MPVRPKLVFAVALPLVAYVALTVIWLLPDLGSLEATQVFAIAKHLVIILLIVASLFFYLQVGCWVALAWCAFVPFERCAALLRELMAVSSGASWSVATVDIVRIFLLLTAGILSVALVINVHLNRTKSAEGRVDA